MYSSDDLRHRIGEQDWHAVGTRGRQDNPGPVGHDPVVALGLGSPHDPDIGGVVHLQGNKVTGLRGQRISDSEARLLLILCPVLCRTTCRSRNVNA